MLASFPNVRLSPDLSPAMGSSPVRSGPKSHRSTAVVDPHAPTQRRRGHDVEGKYREPVAKRDAAEWLDRHGVWRRLRRPAARCRRVGQARVPQSRREPAAINSRLQLHAPAAGFPAAIARASRSHLRVRVLPPEDVFMPQSPRADRPRAGHHRHAGCRRSAGAGCPAAAVARKLAPLPANRILSGKSGAGDGIRTLCVPKILSELMP
jgi:hypothetical protein